MALAFRMTGAAACAIALSLAGCAAGSEPAAGEASPTTAAATLTPEPSEVAEAPTEAALLSFDDVCAGLRDAWVNQDPAAAAPFVSDPAVVDTLFSQAFDQAAYNDTSFGGELCILGGNQNVGVIEVQGDGHAGAAAVAMSWHGLEWWTAENYELWESGTPAGQALGTESVLEEFAAAWGAQDVSTLQGMATDDVIATVQQAGAGEVSILWDEEFCGLGDGIEGFCEALFMPEGQTECCAQIWNIGYFLQSNGVLAITDLTFGGDAG